MTIEQAIFEYVSGLSPVSAIVGTRVWTGERWPQSPTLPGVLIMALHIPQGQHLRGPNGYRRTRFRVSSRASTGSSANPRSAAVGLAAAVYGDGLGPQATGLFGFQGDLGGSPIAFYVYNVEDDGYREGWDPDELNQYLVQQDYLVQWRSTP